MAKSPWGATVGTAVALQIGIVLALAVLAGLWGSQAAKSLLYGGGCVAMPNALLAGWLTLRMRRPGGAGFAALLGGELLKLALTLSLLVTVVKFTPALSWPALLIGVFVALKAQWLALWFTRNIQEQQVQTGTHVG